MKQGFEEFKYQMFDGLIGMVVFLPAGGTIILSLAEAVSAIIALTGSYLSSGQSSLLGTNVK
jgi:hypothetical protein